MILDIDISINLERFQASQATTVALLDGGGDLADLHSVVGTLRGRPRRAHVGLVVSTNVQKRHSSHLARSARPLIDYYIHVQKYEAILCK